MVCLVQLFDHFVGAGEQRKRLATSDASRAKVVLLEQGPDWQVSGNITGKSDGFSPLRMRPV